MSHSSPSGDSYHTLSPQLHSSSHLLIVLNNSDSFKKLIGIQEGIFDGICGYH